MAALFKAQPVFAWHLYVFAEHIAIVAFCAHRPPFTGQAHNGLRGRGGYLWKGPPTVHTIQPLYSQFMVKKKKKEKRPPLFLHPRAECCLCAPLFVCFHVFWKHQPFAPLVCDAWWYNDAGPQTGNNLRLFFPPLCACVCVFVFVSLCSQVAVFVCMK